MRSHYRGRFPAEARTAIGETRASQLRGRFFAARSHYRGRFPADARTAIGKFARVSRGGSFSRRGRIIGGEVILPEFPSREMEAHRASPLHSRRSSIQNPPPSRSCPQRFRTAPQARIDRADQFFWNNAGRLGQSQLPAAARITPPDITETAQVKYRFRQPDSRANQSPLPAGRAAMESPASPFKSSCPQSF